MNILLVIFYCRPRPELNFEELNMQVLFPERLKTAHLCIRAMYIPYDHYSFKCRSFKEPKIPDMLLIGRFLTSKLNKITTDFQNFRSKWQYTDRMGRETGTDKRTGKKGTRTTNCRWNHRRTSRRGVCTHRTRNTKRC